MLQQEMPQDFLVATGRTVSLEYFVQRSFEFFNLDLSKHTLFDKNLFRPSDIRYSAADISDTIIGLKWKPKYDVDDVIDLMCQSASKHEVR
jgi:GDPmannose 4,6-dehydratase